MKWLMLGAGGLVLVALLVGLAPSGETMIGEYSTSLKGRTRGQRINAMKALGSVNGAWIQPGATVSFNNLVGSWSKDRGFQKAPVSFNGQLLPAFGGGVCQTSTTLYNAGLRAGLEVVERHRHHFMPTYVPPGRDSAVAFPDIDLKLRNPYDFPIRIEARKVQEDIVVRLWSKSRLSETPVVQEIVHSKFEPRILQISDENRRASVNLGKPGFEVSVVRRWSGRIEQISTDTYPSMSKIVNDRPE